MAPSKKRVAGGVVLHHASVQLERKLFAYYQELQQDETFQAELRQLWRDVGSPLYPTGPRESADEDELEEWTPPRLAKGASRKVTAFCARWPLATGAASHVSRCLQMAFFWEGTGPYLSLTVLKKFPYRAGTEGEFTVRYDPTREKRKVALRRVEGTFRAWEQELAASGFSRIPPQSNDRQVQRNARRLYLRAVRLLTYEAIAAEEGDASGIQVEASAVRKQVTTWADDLGVPLRDTGALSKVHKTPRR